MPSADTAGAGLAATGASLNTLKASQDFELKKFRGGHLFGQLAPRHHAPQALGDHSRCGSTATQDDWGLSGNWNHLCAHQVLEVQVGVASAQATLFQRKAISISD